MKVRIVANPISGGGRGRTQAEALHRALQSKVEDPELVLTQRAGDATSAAGRPGADCIVAVGGDGTVNEIANGMRETDALLAILPMGTANVVARELGIPNDPEAVAQLIAAESVRVMDAGVADEKLFLLGAGAGLDAAIAKAVSEHRGKSSSYIRWVMPTIRTSFSYTYPEIRVVVDGETVSETAQYTIVGNCRYSAGAFEATPKARIDDGLLDVCMFHRLSIPKLVLILSQVRSGRFLEWDDVTYVQGREIQLEAAGNEAVPLQIDGDPAGEIPRAFSVVPGAIRVVAPI